LSKLNTEVKDF